LSQQQMLLYITSNDFKRQEMSAILSTEAFADGTPIREIFGVEYESLPIKEELEVDIEKMVRAEVLEAYRQVRVPCFVEHAGLIFENHLTAGYPGGLTKPLWNSLGKQFLSETRCAGRSAIARAVVAYCDGKKIHTFVGETLGSIANEEALGREFYWDTVFIPVGETRTYAQIVQECGLGEKLKFSQSAKAIMKFLEFRKESGLPRYWV